MPGHPAIAARELFDGWGKKGGRVNTAPKSRSDPIAAATRRNEGTEHNTGKKLPASSSTTVYSMHITPLRRDQGTHIRRLATTA